MKQAHVLSEHELRRVLHMCTTSKHGDRNRMAVLLSHHAGLRVGEIASLTWDQVLDVNREIRRSFYLLAAKTKAGEAREVFLNGVLRRELTRFLDGQRVQAAKPAPIIRSQKWRVLGQQPLSVVRSHLPTCGCHRCHITQRQTLVYHKPGTKVSRPRSSWNWPVTSSSPPPSVTSKSLAI